MLTQLRSWWRALRHRSEFEREMDDELRFHLDSRADDLARSGLSRAEAVRRARLEFGNPEAWQDRCRESRRLHLADDLRLDLRFALRSIRRDAVLSATVIVTLALGIGATSAIFSVVNGVLLRPLRFPEPDRLMLVGGADPRKGGIYTLFGPDFTEARAGCRLCEDMAAYSGTYPGSLAGGTEPERVSLGHVTGSLFSTLRVQPLLGRTFLPEDTGRPLFGASTESTPVSAVILGYEIWRSRFGGDPAAVGRTVRVEGDPCTIVGVMPQGFDFPDKAQAWVPATVNTKRDNAYLRVIARLRPGVTPAAAQAALEAAARAQDAQAPERRRQGTFTVLSLQEHLVGNIRAALLTFLGATGFVLLIACANVANLLLAQAAARPKELAIRTSLGASRSRIVRQLLTESVLLSTIGGGLGLALAVWLVRAFVAFGPAEIPRLDDVSIDRWVLAFTLLLSVATGLIFGLAPGLRASSQDPHAALQDGAGRATLNVASNRLRKLLVIGEVALALILLIGAGLLARSFVQLRQTAMGFDPHGVLTASLTLPDSTYPTKAHAERYFDQALERAAALPDVRAVGIVNALPLGRYGARVSGDFTVDGESVARRGSWARKMVAGGDYFRAAGIPLLRGRIFDDRDREESPGVVIVSESLARRLWPNQDALGKRINIGFGGETWREVVGVVGDVKHDELGERQVPALYGPYRQVKDTTRWLLSEMTIVVRTDGPPDGVAVALRGTLAQIDRDLPLYDVSLMTDLVARNTAAPEFYTVLLLSFSLLALLLAAAGIYGVMAHSVAQRTHEIGIRIALGARPGRVVRLMVGEGMGLVAVGCALGIAGAFAATRVLSRFLYSISATDRGTFALFSLLLGAVALLACYLPARRAAGIDPIRALRAE
jgi:putative ABC transport system permease protein